MRGLLFLVLSVFFITACSNNDENKRIGIDPEPQYKASSKIEESFVNNGSQFLTLKKQALEKEFLLQGNQILQVPAPMFEGMASRVVSFRLRGNKLYMLESSQGHHIEESIPVDLLLAEFPVISENTDEVVFDFNAGMKDLIQVGEWYTSDDSADASYTLKAADVRVSYIEKPEFKNNILYIKQVAQIAADKKLVPMAVKYYLQPYLPNPDFLPTRNPGFSKVGYFEARPLLGADGATFTYATKWDHKKPIVYAISANTPAEFKPVLKEAVLYFNKILGQGKLQVIELTDKKIVAPDVNYNVVQWIDWVSAGMAYADAQVDPRSGEILHAQIFMTSVFAVKSVQGAQRRLRELQQDLQSGPKTKIQLRGFANKKLCSVPTQKALQTLEVIANSNMTDAQVEKYVKDSVLETVAHEVGHTMGLRHNFAGSLGANYNWEGRMQAFADYIKNGKTTETVVPSSSVMDYNEVRDANMMGDLITNAKVPAFSYDQYAISYLYNNKKWDEKIPAFCTDTQLGKYIDCVQFDAANDAFDYSQKKSEYLRSHTALTLFNNLLDGTLPPLEVLVPTFLVEKTKLIKTMSHELKVLGFRQAWKQPRYLPDEIEKQEMDFIQQKATEIGGLAKIFAIVPDDFEAVVMKDFEAILANPDFTKGKNGDQAFDLSEEQKKKMRTQVQQYLPALKAKLLEADLKLLNLSFAKKPADDEEEGAANTESKPSQWADHPFSYDISTQLLQISQKILLSSLPERSLPVPVVAKDGSIKQVTLTKYQYSDSERALAATLLQKSKGSAVDWAFGERATLSDAIDHEMQTVGTLENIDAAKSAHEVIRWLLKNDSLKSSLMQ